MSIKKITATVALIGALCAVNSGSAQVRRTTLAEAARDWDKTRGPLYHTRAVDFVMKPFSVMVRESDLIVEGSVRVANTYLSADQTALYTDYAVTPTRVYFQRRSPAAKVPGPNPLVVKQWGGKTVIDGTEVIVEDSTLPLLPTDTPLVLFLTFDDADKRYTIYNESTGAVAVVTSRMKLLHKPASIYERFQRMPHGQFVQELARELPAVAKQ